MAGLFFLHGKDVSISKVVASFNTLSHIKSKISSYRKEFNVTNVKLASSFRLHAGVKVFWIVLGKLLVCRGTNSNMVTPYK